MLEVIHELLAELDIPLGYRLYEDVFCVSMRYPAGTRCFQVCDDSDAPFGSVYYANERALYMTEEELGHLSVHDLATRLQDLAAF